MPKILLKINEEITFFFCVSWCNFVVKNHKEETLKQLMKIYEDYLDGIGKLDKKIYMGRGKDTKPVEDKEILKQESHILSKRLSKRFKFNDNIIRIAIVLLCLLFAIGVTLIFYYRDLPHVMGGVFSGTFLLLYIIIRWLHKLWEEKSHMDFVLVIFDGLPPEKAAEFLINHYWKLRSSSKGKYDFTSPGTNPVKKILLLTSNPKTTFRLRLDEEVREIEDGLRCSKHHGQFEIQSRWAVRFRDLRRALLYVEPHIVHFSGHGEKDGLLVEDELGMAVRISNKALSGLFKLCSHQLECVILSACYSARHATAISKHINYVIGMRKEIKDESAIEFAVGFYDTLGAGQSVEKAFKFGCNAILQKFPDLPEHLIPVLKKKNWIRKIVQ
jgi:hypothetical protein